MPYKRRQGFVSEPRAPQKRTCIREILYVGLLATFRTMKVTEGCCLSAVDLPNPMRPEPTSVISSLRTSLSGSPIVRRYVPFKLRSIRMKTPRRFSIRACSREASGSGTTNSLSAPRPIPSTGRCSPSSIVKASNVTDSRAFFFDFGSAMLLASVIDLLS